MRVRGAEWAALLALGCLLASSPALAAGKSCFYARNVGGFSAPNDRTLYVRAGVRDVYELKLFSTCLDIGWVNSLALVSRPSSFICEGSNVDVDVVTRGSGFGRQRCPVTTVRKLTPEEIAALPKRDRP
jgi:hypothetical protein